MTTRQERECPLSRLPAAVVVKNRIARLDEERRKLLKLLEICESVEKQLPLSSVTIDSQTLALVTSKGPGNVGTK